MSRDDGHGANVPDERKQAFGERYQPRYSGVATFMRRPLREEPATWDGIDIGIVGVPFDGGVTNRTGARHGPRHLRDQSTLMGVVNHQTGVRPHDLAARSPTSATSSSRACTASTRRLRTSNATSTGSRRPASRR